MTTVDNYSQLYVIVVHHLASSGIMNTIRQICICIIVADVVWTGLSITKCVSWDQTVFDAVYT